MQNVGRSLPIHKATGELMAHHLLAERWDLWNADNRFDDFEPALSEEPLIVEVGGNTHAEDSRRFLEIFPRAQIHIYEPIPSYAESLRNVWKDSGPQIHIHEVGLGSVSKVLRLSSDGLNGQGTYIMDPVELAGIEGELERPQDLKIHIADAKEEMDDHLRRQDGKPVDILHMNCEGCEWEMLTRLMDADMLQYVKMLQVSFHNYSEKGIGYLLPQYCLIHEHLMRTHDKVFAVPFAWERWSLKQK
jgi:FkbM family methyltransferase